MANHGRRYDAERRGERQEKSAHSGQLKAKQARARRDALRKKLKGN